MIYEVEGDILLSRAEVIAQEVAIGDPMVLGLARRLAARYPTMVKDFHQWCQQELPELGNIWYWEGRPRGPSNSGVVNLITRSESGDRFREPGRASQVALLHGLRGLSELVKTQRLSSIAIPKLGVDTGGLDWYDTRWMIYTQLGDLLIPVFVYDNDRVGQVAFEPGL